MEDSSGRSHSYPRDCVNPSALNRDSMMVPEPDLPYVRPATANRALSRSRRVLRIFLVLGLIAVAGWFLWLYGQIHFSATHDLARPADAIAVFGAAEYDGRPSPVLRARLDHALVLYRQRLAPLVITLGGGEGGPRDSEGGVGHDYLIAHEVPENQIIAEPQSTNTEESAARLAAIARENHLNRILAVS